MGHGTNITIITASKVTPGPTQAKHRSLQCYSCQLVKANRTCGPNPGPGGSFFHTAVEKDLTRIQFARALFIKDTVRSSLFSQFTEPAIKHKRTERQNGGDNAGKREPFGDRHTPGGH